MFNTKPDLTIKQVSTPYEHRCSSGHKAPENFKLEGAHGQETPTRFFEIYKGSEYLGIFCEPCLIISNYIARQKKKG